MKPMTTHTPGTDAAAALHAEVLTEVLSGAHRSEGMSFEDRLVQLVQKIDHRLVSAAWTLRRLPDRERGFMRMRTMLWQEGPAEAGTYAPDSMTTLQARRQGRIEAREIDAMQPTLDLLPLLPDVTDRQILFWAAWHQDGEPSAKIPWAKVRRSMGVDLSRWTLKRRNDAGLRWLAQIVIAQVR